MGSAPAISEQIAAATAIDAVANAAIRYFAMSISTYRAVFKMLRERKIASNLELD
jgi:hypothetical protein